MMDCAGEGDHLQATSELSFPILKQASKYLSDADVRNCKLVCQAWRLWMSCVKGHCNAALVFHIPHVVEKVFSYMSLKEKLNSRLISESFDLVASKHLVFKPILTDTTKCSILKMGPDLRVEEIRGVGLYLPLPVDEEDGKLKTSMAVSHVKSLIFFEGVSAENKIVLLKSFPFLQQLRYVSATNQSSIPGGSNLRYLKVLEIRTSVYNEDGSLTSFLTNEYFPALEEIDFHLYTRLDFVMYLQVHRFIAAHLKHLRKLNLSFASDFSFVRENVTNMLRNFPTDLNELWLQVAQTFEHNENVLDQCRFRFHRCEGVSRFRLTTILFDNQQRLNPSAMLLFDNRAELMGHEEEEDEEMEDEEEEEEIEDELPDENDRRYLQLLAEPMAMDDEVGGAEFPSDSDVDEEYLQQENEEEGVMEVRTSDEEEEEVEQNEVEDLLRVNENDVVHIDEDHEEEEEEN